MPFRALIVEQEVDAGKVRDHRVDVVDDAPEEMLDTFAAEEGVDVNVRYSGLNYKDALVVAGRPGVARRSPIIPGIDLVGTVSSSADPRWTTGQRVILTGDGLGETRHGGFATHARVAGDALVELPPDLTPRTAAAIGTAGFTAMLSLLALERHGVTPDAGTVLVTGAGGGVGSIAVALLTAAGYEVAACSGRTDRESDYFARLGATELVHRKELADRGAPLQRRRWSGAIDCVGSTLLANVLAQTDDGGTVTACGLAGGADLPTTVMPFILRGVSLVGINSVTAPVDLRREAWSRLASLSPELIDELSVQIGLDGVPAQADAVLAGGVRGRTIVDVTR